MLHVPMCASFFPILHQQPTGGSLQTAQLVVGGKTTMLHVL